MRFFPVSHRVHEDDRGAVIIIFAYDDSHHPIAVRVRYPYWFYVDLQKHTLEEAQQCLTIVPSAVIDHKVDMRRSTKDLHTIFTVHRVETAKDDDKKQAIRILKNNNMIVHEDDYMLNPLLKMLADRDIMRHAWLEADVHSPAAKITSRDIEYIASYDTLRMSPTIGGPPPVSILSFDIETDSDNWNRMPDAMAGPLNAIKIICCTYEATRCTPEGLKHIYQEHAIIFGPDMSEWFKDDPIITIHTCTCERNAILMLFKLIITLDPDFVIGHNIMGFDNKYIIDRYRETTMQAISNGTYNGGLDLKMPNISRITGYHSSIRSFDWHNSQYAIQGKYIDTPGRTWIDTMILSSRQFFGKLENNKLDTLAKVVLGMSKNDIDIKDTFRTYKYTRDLHLIRTDPKCPYDKDTLQGLIKDTYNRMIDAHNRKMPSEKKPTVDSTNELISMLNSMNQRKIGEECHDTINHLSNRDIDKVSELYPKYRLMCEETIARWNLSKDDVDEDRMLQTMWYICILYCLQDTRIPLQIINKQGIMPVLMEQSNIFSVDIMDILCKGQLHSTTSSQYKYAYKRGFMMDFGTPGGPIEPYEYEGGYVGRGTPGLRVGDDEIAFVIDFASLYPTIIIAHNLCHSTWVPNKMRSAYLEDGTTPNPHYIWLQYKDTHPMDNIPYEKRGEAMCEIHSVHNSKLNAMHEHWFLKKHVLAGVMPDMLWEQFQARKAIKKKMGEAKARGDNAMYTTYNAQQLATKVSMNATYGGVGTKFNRLANYAAAEVITFIARNSIKLCNEYINKTDDEVIYNDTDSAFILVKDIQRKFGNDPAKIREYADGVAKTLSDLFPSPMALERESFFISYFLRGPKMYSGIFWDGHSMDIRDYTFSYVTAKGLLYIKGLAPVRGDRCKFQRRLTSDILFYILAREDPAKVLEFLEKALFKLWRMCHAFDGGQRHHKHIEEYIAEQLSYNKGFTPKAAQGGGDMAKWAELYTQYSGRKPIAGEKFKLIITKSDVNKTTKHPTKMVTIDWLIAQKRCIDADHYILQLGGDGQVAHLLSMAYPSIFARGMIAGYYLTKLGRNGHLD